MSKPKKVKDAFTIYAALHEDISNCSVWVQHSGIEAFTTRNVVTITNHAAKKSVRCELYKVDNNFRTYYANRGTTKKIPLNANTIVLNYYYRDKLGIQTGTARTLTISKSIPLIGSILLNISHPQNVVRLATWLGIIGVVLGLIGVVFAVQPLM